LDPSGGAVSPVAGVVAVEEAGEAACVVVVVEVVEGPEAVLLAHDDKALIKALFGTRLS
jgi:hypothetical protein